MQRGGLKMCRCFVCKTASYDMTKVWLESLGREVYICTDCAEDFAKKCERQPSGWQIAELIKKHKKIKVQNNAKRANAVGANERLQARFENAMRFMRKEHHIEQK